MENVWRVVDQNKWTFTSCIPNSESDSLWLNLVALSDAPRQHAHLVRSLHAAQASHIGQLDVCTASHALSMSPCQK